MLRGKMTSGIDSVRSCRAIIQCLLSLVCRKGILLKLLSLLSVLPPLYRSLRPLLSRRHTPNYQP